MHSAIDRRATIIIINLQLFNKIQKWQDSLRSSSKLRVFRGKMKIACKYNFGKKLPKKKKKIHQILKFFPGILQALIFLASILFLYPFETPNRKKLFVGYAMTIFVSKITVQTITQHHRNIFVTETRYTWYF